MIPSKRDLFRKRISAFRCSLSILLLFFFYLSYSLNLIPVKIFVNLNIVINFIILSKLEVRLLLLLATFYPTFVEFMAVANYRKEHVVVEGGAKLAFLLFKEATGEVVQSDGNFAMGIVRGHPPYIYLLGVVAIVDKEELLVIVGWLRKEVILDLLLFDKVSEANLPA